MIKINGLWTTSIHQPIHGRDKHFILSPNCNAVYISFILANCHVFYTNDVLEAIVVVAA